MSVVLSVVLKTRYEIRDTIERRINELAHGLATTFQCTAEVLYNREGNLLVNHAQSTKQAIKAARSLVGARNVYDDIEPIGGAEDFADMLEQKTGAFIFMGNGNQSGGLHSPTYNFNDDVIPYGVGYWVSLVQQELQN